MGITLNLHSLLSLLLLVSSVPLLVTSTRCDKNDKNALLAFMDSFGPAGVFSTWNANSSCCKWSGIACGGYTGDRVFALSISDVPALHGPIPPSIGDLPFLQILSFYDLPNLVGLIPPQISKLKRLQFLTISSTNISGPIPAFIGNLPVLTTLDLSLNKLSGAIPAALSRQPALDIIYLNGNRLTGTIPPSLLHNTSDPILDLSDNMLTGPIPPVFGNVDFGRIKLSGNRLTGDASFLFGKSKGLQILDLSSNHRLQFDLTSVEFPQQLIELDLRQNMINGSISPQITTLKNLGIFNVSYNQLCGQIPSGGNLGQFDQSSYAHNKCLCGPPLAPCK